MIVSPANKIGSIRPSTEEARKILEKQKKIAAKSSSQAPSQLKQNFMDWCNRVLYSHPNRHVVIDFDRVHEIANSLKPQDPSNAFDFAPDMTPEAADRSKPINPELVFFALALNTANQGGYIYEGPDGKAVIWQKDGIDVKAFNDLFCELSEKNLLPGLPKSRIKKPSHVEKLMKPELVQENGDPVPFLQDRLQVFKEFAAPGAWEKLATILNSARQQDGSYHFDFKSIYDIAKAFPISFGRDAFLKKPALLPMLFASNANTRGEKVSVDGIVAADFWLPWTDHNTGMARFSDGLVESLENKEIMHPDDLRVLQMRAATVVISDLTAQLSGKPINEIDALKWLEKISRSLQKFQDETKVIAKTCGKKITQNHMLVPTFNF
ncbi:MAG: hypothetical protein HY094_03895 [Candidatus Melainabacteria bacterium]|nr:hypothetical protein [Candidatus Melainabacteria bacterium]